MGKTFWNCFNGLLLFSYFIIQKKSLNIWMVSFLAILSDKMTKKRVENFAILLKGLLLGYLIRHNAKQMCSTCWSCLNGLFITNFVGQNNKQIDKTF
jgi:hypothetical protein